DPPLGEPGFACRLLRAADADPVERASGYHVILYDAPVRPHPDAGDAAEVELGQPLGRHESAPGDISRVARQFLPEELPAHRRVDAVGADQHVARGLHAIGQRDGDTVRGLRESLDAGIESETRVGDPVEHYIEEVGAMCVVVGRPELCLRPRAERGVVEAVAGIPSAAGPSLPLNTDTRPRFATPRPTPHAGGVWTKPETHPHPTGGFGPPGTV